MGIKVQGTIPLILGYIASAKVDGKVKADRNQDNMTRPRVHVNKDNDHVGLIY